MGFQKQQKTQEDLYRQYLSLKNRFLKRMIKLLNARHYEPIKITWDQEKEVHVYMSSDLSSLFRLIINEKSNLAFDTINYKDNKSFSIFCEDAEIQSFLDSSTELNKMKELLNEVQYMSGMEKTLASLKGELND